MKNIKLSLLSLLSLFLIFSCGSDDDSTIEPIPSSFTVTASNIGMSEFTVDWTESTIDGDAGVVYDIFLDDILVVSDFDELTYTFTDLDAGTTYNVELEAKSNEFDTSITQNIDVTTSTVPTPSSFTISSRDVTISEFTVDWTESIIDGDAGVVYDIYLDDILVVSDFDELTYTFIDLDAETVYSVEVEAKSNEFETTSLQMIEVATLDLPVPSTFEISFNDVTSTEFTINWTESTIDGDAGVVYDIYLDDTLVVSDLDGLTHTFIDLDAETVYSVEVEAKSNEFETTSLQMIEVTTLDLPVPSTFEISSINVASSEFTVNWTESTIDGNAGVVYDIYLDDILIVSDLDELTYTFTNLNAETSYEVQIEAKSNEFQTTLIQSIVVTTESGPLPNDFEITLNNVGTGSASISWTSLTINGDGGVLADIYLNGVEVSTGVTSTGWVFTGLTPNTDYTATVIARSTAYGTTLEREINFTTEDLPTTFEVTSAVLGARTTGTFGSPPRIIIRFSNRDFLDGIILNNITYNNYAFAGSDGIIISISDDEYDVLSSASTKEGTANFTENGVASSLVFEYTVE